MRKLLLLLDTDATPSVFDTIVGYDGGADQVVSYAGRTPDNVGALIEAAFFARGATEKKNTAIFIGGSSMSAGEGVLIAVNKQLSSSFPMSVMLDSNGSNTTAAAAVAQIAKALRLAGKKAVVLAGTGAVGLRAAALLAKEGAQVKLTSRDKKRAETACKLIEARFGVSPTPVGAADNDARGAAVEGADLVFATGPMGVELIEERHWRNEWTIELIADCNAQPPLGIGGIEVTDKGKTRQNKLSLGAVGIYALKLKLHRACIGQLFQSSGQVLDAEEIYALAKTMA